MTIRNFNQLGGSGRYRSATLQWPHVGECTGFAVLGMARQRDGRRVSAAGEAR